MNIEEMANSAYFMQQHSGSLTEEEYEDVKYGIEVRRKAYIKGANAVLEEIVLILECSTMGNDTVRTRLRQIIKEFKGGNK